ncbi:MAG: alpha/beta hydrolase [Pseudomonadota bacterium]
MSTFTSDTSFDPILQPPYKTSLFALLLAIVLLVTGCSRLFYYPDKKLIRNPSDIGVCYEDVQFPSEDGIDLHGWFLPAAGRAKGTILFFHGNAENISTHIGAVYWLPENGFNVFIFDYRGFGNSAGEARNQGVHRDARSALSYLLKRSDVDPERLILFGQSIGGAIALYTAATSGIAISAVVAESSFSSYPGILREKMSGLFLTWPFQWLAWTMTSRYDPVTVVQDIRPVPLLLIHGDKDNTVAIQHAYTLFEAARGNKQLWVVKGGGHISAFAPRRGNFRQRLLDYLEGVLSSN